MNRRSCIPLIVVAALFSTNCGGRKTAAVELGGSWKFAIDSARIGVQKGWFANEYDRSGWKELRVPGHWDSTGLETYDGVGWYATTFSWDDTTSPAIFFEGVDDDADVWIDGVSVAEHTGYNEPFVAVAPEGVRGDSISLVVRVTDNGGPGGLHKPVTVIPAISAEEQMKSPLAARRARTSAPWVSGAVVYEVYLRSFSPHGFRGLENRLQELQDIGVTVLWLMPIHPIGELNRKGTLGSPYAIQDYYGINPEFGSAEDFRSLVRSAHKLGMRVIIDLVANHTSWDSALLIKHPEWFTHDSDGAIVAPNDDWTDVADLNYESHELRKYMIAMMEHWVREFDIDGYRCDVAEMVPTDFWELARRELEKIKPVMMLSEGSLPEHHIEGFDVTYAWNTYDALDPLLTGSAKAGRIYDLLRREQNRFPQGSLRLRFNTNHDKNAWDAPAVVKFGPDGSDLAAVLMFTLPGIPLIYNGEEVGNARRLELFEQIPIAWSDGGRHRSMYRTLGALRKNNPWLSTGELSSLQNTGGDKVLSFLRTDAASGTRVLCIVNFGKNETKVDIALPEELRSRPLKDVFTLAILAPREQLTVQMPARGYAVYTISTAQ